MGRLLSLPSEVSRRRSGQAAYAVACESEPTALRDGLLSVSVGVGYFGAERTSVWLAFDVIAPALTLVFTFMGSSPVTTIEVSRGRSGQAASTAACERAQRSGMVFPSRRHFAVGLFAARRATTAAWASLS